MKPRCDSSLNSFVSERGKYGAMNSINVLVQGGVTDETRFTSPFKLRLMTVGDPAPTKKS